MSIYDYENYKNYVNDWIKSRPKKGRGELQRISKALQVHPTLASHIFRGPKDLSLEQASSLSIYLQLKEMETDYFLLLVQKEKAGTVELKKIINRQLLDLRSKATELVNRVSHSNKLSDEDKGIFYSNWYYSAIRLLTSLESYQSKESINEVLKLPDHILEQVLEFLVTRGLCKQQGDQYSMGPAVTHLESSSPHITRHHTNWRLKAIESHQNLKENELAFSAPLTISKKDAKIVREQIVSFIDQLSTRVKDSPAEELMCLNIDWVFVIK